MAGAMVTVLELEDQQHNFVVGGALARPIGCIEEGLSSWGIEPSSAVAEFVALLWAMVLCIGWRFNGVSCKLVVHSDCQLALNAAEFEADKGHVGVLAAAVAGLAQTLIPMGNGKFEHVKAHVGHPWNECADSLADEARKHSRCLGSVKLRVFEVVQATWSPDFGCWWTPLAWTFYDAVPTRDCDAYPKV